ncbi:MAG: hypothetical protein QOJ02_626 [Acidobacteriota bacterium]|jgi:hypothetical protein|nr:hypothetical protein [Acidobacteriota bacterium]
MSTLNHQSRKRVFLTTFILLFCSLMAFQFAPPARAVTGEASIPQETPTPSPEGGRSTNVQQTVKIIIDWWMNRKIKFLLESGPQFPERFDTRDFSVDVLLKGHWPVAIEYELEQEATATVVVTVKGAKPFSFNLPATGTGHPHAASFILPDHFGDQLLPAKISFKAEKQTSAGHELAQFELYALAIGPDAARPAQPGQPQPNQPQPNQPQPNQLQPNSRNRFETASDSFQADHHLSLAKAQGSAAVDRVIFDRPSINVSMNEVVTYSFQAAARFERWSATFFSIYISSRNKRMEHVSRELVLQSTRVSGKWDGKDERHKLVPAGTYTVLIRAWRVVGGPSASAFSQQNVIVN